MRRTLLILMAIAVIGVFNANAATIINIVGSTEGCFFANGDSPCTPGAGTTQVGELVYNPATFDVNTNPADGAASVGNIGQPPGTANFNNFGSFTLPANPANFNYGDYNFVLRLLLTAPAPGNAPGKLFTADILGSVSAGNSSVAISFPGMSHTGGNPPTFLYDYAVPAGPSGTIAVHIESPTVSTNGTAGLFGHFHTTEVPEPGTTALMGSGLLLLGLLTRRFVR